MTADRRIQPTVPKRLGSISRPIGPFRHRGWRQVTVIALTVAAAGFLGACSSDDTGGAAAPETTAASGPAVTTAGNEGSVAAAAGDAGSAATTAAGTDGASATTDLAGYYESIGVAPDVADCYARALADIGITEVGLLETDPEKSAAAAALFDGCIADPSGTATSTP